MNVNTAQAIKSNTAPVIADTEAVNNAKKTADQLQSKPLEEKKQKESLPVNEMKALAIDLNEYMDDLQTNLGFFINEKLNGQVIVEIKNRKTNELVKQIPSEEIVAIREKMAELTGLLLDKSV